MPHDPEDDWTRPIPRSARPSPEPGEGPSQRPRDDDRTQLIGQRDRGNDRRSGVSRDDDRTQMIGTGSTEDSPPEQMVGYGRSRDAITPMPRYLRDRDDAVTGPGEDSWQDQEWEPQERSTAPAGPGRAGNGQGGRPGGPPPGPPPGPRKRRPRYGLRRLLVVLLVLILAYVGAMIWAVSSVWGSVDRVDATPTSADRPADGSGTNFLMVGTDSRENLDQDRRNELVTGHDLSSVRADTIMLLHLPDSGGPVLISIPRDSYVEIPGQGYNKINAAYSIGGPALLVDAVEQSTGMRVDGYLEIGFAGFVDVVDIVGGVEMCLDEPVQDDMTRLDLPAGCQNLIGAEALNYVRMRYADPMGDLGRVERQRQFLSALIGDIATPANVLLPWRLNDIGTRTASVLTIGEDTSMWEAGRMAWAMRQLAGGGGHSLTVPIADSNYPTAVGSSVLWDEAESQRLFEDLNTGRSLTVDP